ncbi:MAG: glycosyltransferase family 2 protein [Clostridia bacterium]|nr:glycosyltransferase family 2 protein [Clostridia bacterium]
MPPLISAIVPVYNSSEHLKKCLDSLSGQSFGDFEIILINDGSTDNSGDICRQYAQRDKRIKYCEQQNAGPSAARNRGIELSSGQYLIFVDSDDWIEGDTFEKLFHTIGKNSFKMIFFEHSIDDEKGAEPHSLPDEWYGETDREKAVRLLMLNPFLGNKLVSRQTVGKIRFNEGYYRAEDTLFWLRCVLSCDSFCSLKNPFYHYVQSRDSICRTDQFNPRQLTGLDAYGEMLELAESRLPNTAGVVRERFLNFCLVLWGQMCDTGFDDGENRERIRKTFLSAYRSADKSALSRKTRLKYKIFCISPAAYMLLRRFG